MIKIVSSERRESAADRTPPKDAPSHHRRGLRRGIWVARNKAADVNKALKTWMLRLIAEKSAGDIPEKAFGQASDGPVALEGLTSVRCVSAPAMRGLAQAYIVRTA